MKDEFLEKNPFGKYDSKAFETSNMNKFVTEDQYTRVLQIKNKSQAETEAKADWDELKQRGMAEGLNEETIYKQFYAYYLAKWIAYYRYGDDPVKRNANVKNIQEHMPSVLQGLYAARKYNNPTSTITNSFHW